ncbi:MAG: efflux RND transporter periplasmic adaptor subunit [Phycisphaerae bacterium]|jgi:RND family efflux transporter MFP subunit
MRTKIAILATLAAVGVAATAVWLGAAHKEASADELAAPAQPTSRPVPTAVVRRLSGDRVYTFPGTVRATRRVQLAFSVAGLLVELHAQEGLKLRQGEVLARLDPRDYQHARDAAAARYADSKQDFRRLKALRDQKAAAEAEYDEAEAAHAVAEAELRVCEKALDDTVLLAPFDGIVARRYVENYEHVAAKQPVLSFQDISVLEVVVAVPERLIARGGVAALGELHVRFDADEERWLDADIREFSVQSDPVTRTFDVVVGLTPPANMEVLPGMTATVRARTPGDVGECDAGAQRALVPVEAIVRGPDGASYVWVIEPAGGTPYRQSVELGILHEDGVEIVGGLRPGQHVAVAGLHTLREDMHARPMAEGGEGLDG